MNIENFSFENIYAFYLLFLLLILFFISSTTKSYDNIFSKDMLNKIIFGVSAKQRNFILMLVAFVFLVIALARPVILNKPVKVNQKSLSLVVAFDVSKSMKCEDVYPNRLEFSKNKFSSLLDNFKDEKVGAIGFSSRSYLLAPITNDYLTLKYLIKNLNTSYINVRGSDVYEALQSTNNLLKNSKQKALIIFTDGTDNKEFAKSIEFANKNNIKVFIYAIATLKGGVIKTKDGVQKDSNGNIVVTKLNANIKELAFKTSGAYLEYSSSPNDIKEFVKIIRKQFKDDSKSEKDIVINTNKELYIFPLGFGFLLILISLIGLKRVKK